MRALLGSYTRLKIELHFKLYSKETICAILLKDRKIR